MVTEGILAIGTLLLLGVVIAAEIYWLVNKGWATSGRASAFVLITDLLSIGLGLVVLAIGFTVFIMMAFGHSGTGSGLPDSVFIAVIIATVIIPPIILFFVKRIMLSVLRIKTGSAAWSYSLVTTILFTVCFILPPSVVYYLALSYPIGIG